MYKRQDQEQRPRGELPVRDDRTERGGRAAARPTADPASGCLLYTSDAADDPLCVDLGGRRIIKKKKL